MQLDLSDVQAELLARVLQSRLGDYSVQIADTNTSEFREQLRKERDELQQILDKLPDA